jgi:hypothetical protein
MVLTIHQVAVGQAFSQQEPDVEINAGGGLPAPA